jgi:hypothetical protein
MTSEDIKAQYAKAAPNEQLVILAGLAHEVTIIGRAYYTNGPDGQDAPGPTMIALNELQHQISGQMSHLARNNALRYPDDVFVNILFERAQYGHLEEEFLRGFALVISRGSK